MLAKVRFSRCWQSVMFTDTLFISASESSSAQVVPDSILNHEGFVITPDVTIQGIESGSFAVAEGTNVETLPNHNPPLSRQTWQKGDPIAEPQGVYRLLNGKLVLSRNCF